MDKHLRRGLPETASPSSNSCSSRRLSGYWRPLPCRSLRISLLKQKKRRSWGNWGLFEGRFPGNSLIAGFGANFILAPKYMDGPITISLPTVPIHKSGNYVTSWVDPDYSSVLGFKSYGQILSGSDDYPWAYNYATGHLTVHFTHTRSRGLVWSSY